jgi:hypothetical protein
LYSEHLKKAFKTLHPSTLRLHGFAHQTYRRAFVFGITQMVAAESKRRDSHVMPGDLTGT